MHRDFNYDSDLLLEDSLDSAGASSPIITSQAGKVLDVAEVIDIGTGFFDGNLVIDVSALEVGTDEYYELKLQGAAVVGFTGDIQDLAYIKLGIAATLVGTVDSAIGRYVVPCSNEKNGTTYQYLRFYALVFNGTAESITLKAWLTKR